MRKQSPSHHDKQHKARVFYDSSGKSSFIFTFLSIIVVELNGTTALNAIEENNKIMCAVEDNETQEAII